MKFIEQTLLFFFAFMKLPMAECTLFLFSRMNTFIAFLQVSTSYKTLFIFNQAGYPTEENLIKMRTNLNVIKSNIYE